MRVLGGVRVGDRVPTALGQELLATLVAAAPHPVSAERLAELCWGNVERTSAGRIRTALSRLRPLLPDGAIVHEPAGYRLDLDVDEVDAWRFAASARDASSDRATERQADDRRRAFELWPADHALWGGPSNEVVDARLAEWRLLHEQLVIALARSAEPPAGVPGVALQMFDQAPDRGDLAAAAALALHGRNRQAEAVTVLARHRTALAARGLVMAHDLVEVERRVLAADAIVDDTSRSRSGVPGTATALIGRIADLERIEQLAGEARHLSLVGLGGVGKTRLVVELARRWQRAGREVHFVASAGSADEPAVAIANGLGFQVVGDARQTLATQLQRSDAALVLDACEVSAAAMGALIDELLGRCPSLAVVTTSRRPLGNRGETVFHVEPMTPDDAVRLLHSRLPRRRTVERADDSWLGEVVRRLDHLPLAIEIAASRLAGTSVDTFLRQIEPAGDGDEHVLDRVLERSVQLLSPAAQDDLASLAVMVGSFDDELLAAVADRPLTRARATVAELAACSLIAPAPGVDGGAFVALDTVRHFAFRRALRSGTLPDLQRRHARHLADRSTELAREEFTALAALTDRELRSWVDHLRAAFTWSLVEDPPIALQLVRALHVWSVNHLVYDVIPWAEQLLSAHRADLDDATLAEIAGLAASGAWFRGDARTTSSCLDEALAAGARAQIPVDVHTANTRLALAFSSDGPPPESLLMEMIGAAARDPDPFWRINAYVVLSIGAVANGLDDAAAALARSAAEAADASPSPSVHAWVSYAMGMVALHERPAQALVNLRTAEELATTTGAGLIRWMSVTAAATAARLAGRPRLAARALCGALQAWTDGALAAQVAHCLREAAMQLHEAGDLDTARVALATAACVPISLPSYAFDRERLERVRLDTGVSGPHPPAPLERLVSTTAQVIQALRALDAPLTHEEIS